MSKTHEYAKIYKEEANSAIFNPFSFLNPLCIVHSFMASYSVPEESHKLLLNGIINNPLYAFLPSEIKDAVKNVEYTGTNAPSIPINWRFAESISSIKGFQASMLNVLLKKKYGLDYQKVVIDTFVFYCMFSNMLYHDAEDVYISRSLSQ